MNPKDPSVSLLPLASSAQPNNNFWAWLRESDWLNQCTCPTLIRATGRYDWLLKEKAFSSIVYFHNWFKMLYYFSAHLFFFLCEVSLKIYIYWVYFIRRVVLTRLSPEVKRWWCPKPCTSALSQCRHFES